MANIHHELFIAASVEKVYNALATQEGLSAWWTPGTVAEAEVDSISKFSFGRDYFKEMKIISLKPSEHVRWICIHGADEWIGTSVSFSIESGDKETLLNLHPEISDQLNQDTSEDKGTILIFRHDGWKENTSMFAECSYTWALF